MEYDKATSALQGTEQDAVDGLLRFVAPQLLAEIHMQRGLLLLPTKPNVARKALRQSFAVHPREIKGGALSPKILAELRKANAASPMRPPEISVAEASSAAAALAVVHLILPTVRDGADTELQLVVFDAKSRTWRRTTSSMSEKQLAITLRAVLDLPPAVAPPVRLEISAPASAPVEPAPATAARAGDDRSRRSIWPWVAASVGAAGAILGTTLWVISDDRVTKAEGFAGRDPLLEYAADAEGLETSARQLRAGSIVSLIAAGVAITAAAVGWLRAGRGRPRGAKRRASVSIGIDARSLTVQFP